MDCTTADHSTSNELINYSAFLFDTNTIEHIVWMDNRYKYRIYQFINKCVG